jgi:hypothetical protein
VHAENAQISAVEGVRSLGEVPFDHEHEPCRAAVVMRRRASAARPPREHDLALVALMKDAPPVGLLRLGLGLVRPQLGRAPSQRVT